MKRTAMLVLLASATLLQGCKTGYNKPLDFGNTDKGENARNCSDKPSNADANEVAVALYNRLRNLSCTDTKPQGVLMGQSAGAGNQMLTVADLDYQRLFTRLTSEFQITPAVISLDYEREMVFGEDALFFAHDQLVAHAGIISISWSPLNPWIPDLGPGEGSPEDLAWTESVDLAALLDPESAIHASWMARVDSVARMLEDLQGRGVAVLWQPLPQMNSAEVWWGVQTDSTSASPYKRLWNHLYDTFEERGLNNLLWVYSPVTGTPLPTGEGEVTGAPLHWAYPGNDQVDVVAPVIRNNTLEISDYSRLTQYRKPIGLAEYGPVHADDADFGESQPFDASQYASILAEDYPAIAYWVSSHSYMDNNGDWLPLALIDMEQESLLELAQDDYILTQDDIRKIKAD